MTSIFDQGLAPVDANYAVQSPVDFIERTATVYPEYPAVIHGAIRYNWAQTYERCRRQTEQGGSKARDGGRCVA